MPGVPGAIFMKDSLITLDGTEYPGETTKAQLTPSQTVNQQLTLNPTYVLTDVDTPTWTWDVGGPQNYIDGIAKYLFDHQGEEIDVVMVPRRGTGNVSWSFTVIGMAVPVGGDRGAWNVFDISLAVVGQPVPETVV